VAADRKAIIADRIFQLDPALNPTDILKVMNLAKILMEDLGEQEKHDRIEAIEEDAIGGIPLIELIDIYEKYYLIPPDHAVYIKKKGRQRVEVSPIIIKKKIMDIYFEIIALIILDARILDSLGAAAIGTSGNVKYKKIPTDEDLETRAHLARADYESEQLNKDYSEILKKAIK